MKRRVRLVLLLGLVAVVLVVAGVLLGLHLCYESTVSRLSEQLAEDTAAYRATGPVARPVLRGEPIEGNAAEAQLRLAEPFAALELPESSGEAIMRGETSPELVALARRHEDALQAFRAAARYESAWTDFPLEQGLEAESPDCLPSLRAMKLLLVLALLEGGGTCLQIAADLLRMAHDLVPGGSLVGAMTATAMNRLIVPVAARCASDASIEERRAALDELERLRQTEPDLGGALEVEVLLLGHTFRRALRETPLLPSSPQELGTPQERALMIHAWSVSARDPSRFRSVTIEGYPESRRIWDEHALERQRSDNPVVSAGAERFGRYLDAHMASVARLRGLVAILRALEGVATIDALPEEAPEALRRPELRDPFSGDPLRYRVVEPGRTACVYAVGEDGSDDRCAEGSDDARVLFGPSAPRPASE